MGYFKDEKMEKYEDTSISERLLSELASICLEELMFSSDAYICMMEMNLQGYKRLHRYTSKKFFDLYLEIQKEAVEKHGKALKDSSDFSKYTAKDIKNHIISWNEKLEEHLKAVGEIIKGIFEEEGYISCTAQKVQKMLYKNLIKNERAYKKFEDCNWSYEVIYSHDKYLHDKIREKENK